MFTMFLICLLSSRSTEHDFPSFKNLVDKLEGWKGGTFVVGTGRHFARLRTSVEVMLLSRTLRFDDKPKMH